MISGNAIAVTPGNTTTTTRTVSDFTKLELANGFEATIIPDGTESITIEAPEGYQPYIITVVESGTLKVSFDKNVDASAASPKRATIHVKRLDGIAVSGGCRVTATDTLRSSNLALDASSGADIDFTVADDQIACNVSGGATLSLSGTGGSASFNVSGGSTVHAFDLVADPITVNAAGGSTVEMQSGNGATVSASGGSNIYYKGNPPNVSLSGGSEAIHVD